MKQTVVLFFALFRVTLSWAQIDVNLDINGEYQTVVEIEDSSSNLYKKTKEWIVSSYINPDEVTVADEKNQYIKIRGSQPESSTDGLANPSFHYTLNIEFKEGRYRITYNIIKLYTTGQYGSVWTYDNYYNKNKGVIRKMNEAKVERIKGVVDKLLNNHFDFVTKKEKSVDDDW